MSEKRRSVVKAPPDAVPESEDRVYVYQKSGTDSLKDLEDKRSRYMELDSTLETLPRKLKHSGLVPLGPGLYAQGNIVRTNEILVLLGDSYFAEVSAHDARKIVSRRVAVIDEKISTLEVGRDEVGAALAKPIRISSPMPTAGVKDIPKRPAGFMKGFLNQVALSTEQMKQNRPSVSSKRPPKSPRPPSILGSSPRSTSGDSADPGTAKPTTKKVSFRPDTKGSKTSTLDTVQGLLENFESSVEQAKKLQRESNTRNIEEEYDEFGALKQVRGASLSSSSTSSKDVPDMPKGEIDELYDMTKPPEENKPMDRDDYFKMLLDSEREAEADREREAKEASKRTLRREAREFGSGLSKGFLSAPSKTKSTKSDSKPVELNVKREELEESEANSADDELDKARPVVANTVVERGTGERRRRKPVRTNKERASVFSMRNANSAFERQAQQEAPRDGEYEQSEEPIMLSRFKQMRSMEKR